MWAHASWPGRSLPAGQRLRSYASRCNAVEGGATFYATPARTTVESWARQTVPDFRFVLKLPKVITHERRLAGDEEELRSFLTAIESLGPRAHALWVQLPPSFGPADLGALARFLRGLPRGYRRAVEVRHPAFFAGAARALETVLGRAGAEWVTFDTTALFDGPPAGDAEREAQARKPRLPRRPVALTGDPIVRYIGRDSAERTATGWRPWVETVAAWLGEGRSPTVFIHTPDNADAPWLARRFHDEVRARVPGVDPLPEPTEPLTLF